ncbi:MAG: CvpA family protein [Candidatus Polarisedimenticolia bacterium]
MTPGPFDIGAGVLALVLMAYGAWRGMIRLVLWFAGWVAAWWVALRYSEPLALRLGAGQEVLAGRPDLLRLACFLFLFASVAFVLSLAGWLLARALKMALPKGVDRLMGATAGLLMAILLVCASSVPILAVWPPDGGWLMWDSIVAPYAVAGGRYLQTVAPEPWKSRFSAASQALLSKDVGR